MPSCHCTHEAPSSREKCPEKDVLIWKLYGKIPEINRTLSRTAYSSTPGRRGAKGERTRYCFPVAFLLAQSFLLRSRSLQASLHSCPRHQSALLHLRPLVSFSFGGGKRQGGTINQWTLRVLHQLRTRECLQAPQREPSSWKPPSVQLSEVHGRIVIERGFNRLPEGGDLSRRLAR